MFKLSSGSDYQTFSKNMLVAEKLFQLGARPPIVRSLCNVGHKVAIRLYKEALQLNPKQGLLPYDPFWIIHSSVNAFHASLFITILNDLLDRQSQTFNAEALVTGYELYSQVIAANRHLSKLEASRHNMPVLDINRAWQLVQQLNSKEILIIVCDRCRVRFCTLSTVPKPFQQCPVCDVWCDKQGRRRWMSVNSRQSP